MITLNQKQPFAAGGHYLVFEHPENTRFVLKVVKPEYNYENLKRFSLRKNLFRRYKHYVDCVRVVTGMVAAYLKNNSRPDFLQDFYGFIETDLGIAIIARAERDNEGAFAPTLRNLLQDGNFDETAQRELEDFFEKLLQSDIVLGNISIDNLVYSWDAAKQKSKFVVIDGLGEKNVIPLCSYFRFFNNRAKMRGIQKIQRCICKYQDSARRDESRSGDLQENRV
jgi:hypothetical protein